MTLAPTRVPTVSRLLTGLLDRQYTQAAGAVIQAIANGSTSGLLAQRLKELDAEAARLAAEGLKLTADNPVVRALLADFETQMAANEALVNSAATAVQETGIQAGGVATRQLALPGFSDAQLQALGVTWNVPDPEAVAQVVNYANSEAWRTMIAAYGDGAPQAVLNTALRGMVEGWGPTRTAREMRALVETMPRFQANTLMRTLQLTSFRDSQVAHRIANAGILAYQIRIAALDSSTCLACVALHGKRYPLDARIDDHFNGRCTSITVLRGQEPPDITSGEDWFNARTPQQQRDQMGGAMFEAWQAGAVKLSDIPQTDSDPVFGGMIREASLKGLLGQDAQQYYQ
jgi:hypothetical protein